MPGFGRLGRPSKTIAIAVGTAILLIGVWLIVTRLSAKFSDRSEAFYPSMELAAKDGAVTRGWIPDEFLPRSSRSIHEVHNLSPSTEWCAFEFAPKDSEELLSKLKHVEVLPPQLRHVRKPGVSWWPSILAGDLDVEQIRKSGFNLYLVEKPVTSVSTGHWLFAIDQTRGRGFFYFI